jgi:hypothetical protein
VKVAATTVARREVIRLLKVSSFFFRGLGRLVDFGDCGFK